MSEAPGTWAGSLDEDALCAWGRRIGADAPGGAVLCLSGPLGAGKSTLARAIGRGGGVAEPMPSPTFNLVYAYGLAVGVRLLHYDLYRLRSPEEVESLGWEEVGAPDALTVVEWPERAGPLLPADRWEVGLAIPAGSPDVRVVRVARVGSPPALPAPD